MVFAGFFLVSSRYKSSGVAVSVPSAVFVTGDFDVSGATLVYKDMLLVTPTDIEFSTDGTKLFVCLQGSSTIYEYSLSTAWDLSTLGASATTSLAVSGISSVQSIDFNLSGTKLYACGSGNVAEFPLTTAYDLSTAGSQSTLDISTYSGTDIYGACFSNSASSNYLHFTSSNVEHVNTITTLEIADPLSGSTLVGRSANVVPLLSNVVASDLHTTRTLEVSGGGSRFYQIYRNTDLSNVYVVEFKLGTAHDASTLTSATQIEDYYNLSEQTGGTTLYDTFNSLKIKPDGTEMFLMGTNFLDSQTTIDANSGTTGSVYTSRNLNYAIVQYGNNTNNGIIKVYEYSSETNSYSLRDTISGDASNRLNFGSKVITNDGNTIFSTYNSGTYLNVLTYNGSAWSFTQKTTLSNGGPGGSAMCLSPNEDLLFFATDSYKASGRATGGFEVWAPSNGTWAQTQVVATPNTITSDTANFTTLAVSGDGNTLIAGASFDDTTETDNGLVYFFSNVAGTWTASGETLASPDGGNNIRFGDTGLDTNSDNTRVAVGAHYYPSTNRGIGRVYIYDKINGTWTHTATLDNPESSTLGWFGLSVSFNATGNTLLVGAWLNSTNGRAYAYEYNGSSWILTTTFTHTVASRRFGGFVSLSKSGTDRAVISETQTTSTGYINFYTSPKNAQTYSLDVPEPVFYLSAEVENEVETSNGASNVSLTYSRSSDYFKVGSYSVVASDLDTEIQQGLKASDAYHTYSFWVYFTSVSGTQLLVGTSAYMSSTGGYKVEYISNKLSIYCKNSSGSYDNYETSTVFTSSVLLNKWNHIVLVIPVGAASSVLPYAYLNGVKYESTVVSGNWQDLYYPENQYLNLFTDMTAYVDEYKVFNTMLTEKTVKKIYLDGLTPARTQAFHLTFEDNTGADIIPPGASLGGTSLSTLQSTAVTYQGSYVGDFTATDSVLTISNWTAFDHPFSVSFWMYYTGDTSATNKTIVGTSDFKIRLNGTTLYFYYSGSSLSASVTNLVNHWRHVLITSDGTNHRLFLDGTLSSSASSTVSYTSGQTLYIGAETASSPTEVFTGYLDNIRIWDYMLSPVEVEYLYTSTLVHKNQTFYLSFDKTNTYDYHNGSTDVAATGTGVYYQDPGSKIGTHSGQYPQGSSGTIVPSWPGLTTATSLTFSLWVFPTELSGTHTLYATDNFSGTEGIGAQLVNSSGNLQVRIVTRASSSDLYNYVNLTSVGNFLNKWTHFVFVYTSSTGYIYVNGASQTTTASGTWTFSTGVPAGDDLYIGNYNGTTTIDFDGAIDDFRVFRRELTENEIGALYRQYTQSRLYNSVTTAPDLFSNAHVDLNGVSSSSITTITGAQEARFSGTGEYLLVYNYVGSILIDERLSIYSLSTPFDINSTRTLVTSSGSSSSGRPFGITGVIYDTSHTDYGKLFYGTTDNDNIVKFTASSTFGGTLTNNGTVATISGGISRIWFFDIYDNGSKFVCIDDNNRMYVWNITDYAISGTYEVSSADYSDTSFGTTIGISSGNVAHISWASNGNYALILINNTGEVRVYSTSNAPYDYAKITNIRYLYSFTVSGGSGNFYALEFPRTSDITSGTLGFWQRSATFFQLTA